jgi:iron complex transport system substrate-binding protein
MANPQWQALQAAQGREIYAFPKDFYSWDQPDTRWVLGLTWLAIRIHPEHFAGVNVTEQVNAFFTQLYGMQESEVQERILPQIQGDIE